MPEDENLEPGRVKLPDGRIANVSIRLPDGKKAALVVPKDQESEVGQLLQNMSGARSQGAVMGSIILWVVGAIILIGDFILAQAHTGTIFPRTLGSFLVGCVVAGAVTSFVTNSSMRSGGRFVVFALLVGVYYVTWIVNDPAARARLGL